MANEVLPDPATPFGGRVRRRLTDDLVVWLTTVAHDSTPQPNPVWFLWDGGESLLVYNRPIAKRLVNIRRTPRVSLNFDSSGGRDIVVMTGDAELLDEPATAVPNAAYLEKYRDNIVRVIGDADSFVQAYPVRLRVRLTRVRGF
ncbi:TIGR03667 family PPOX class F420-dependent oxidoreductase [Spongiactinospora gelatinilytica]|uniref:TIGR03667 family PPOX class F420-dependent oxidoreductase n=1 Tax=Spongiactinospora gelatinilytica TaxID=2666298 RepID=A0A2W2G1B2_9ACTN|nr:TIGR03667 family PPOX class F420-dependent oxidoreductase [Spongiactinospora gelatinilytica]PZG41861.1 TIGR03667 family PPOX class F420-dependent oxidoreductase [Spongiactinospora gelatinilytica]